MKRIFTFFALLLTLATTTQAQEFASFKFFAGLGYAIPTKGGEGLLFDLEPAYRINDQIAVGIRYEAAILVKEASSSGTSVSLDASAVASYTINGQYYLSNGNFRPYVGLGLGLFVLGTVKADANTSGSASAGIDAGDKFGVYPRIGFDLGHLNVNLDINLIPKSEITSEAVVNGTATTTTTEITNSYFGLRIGFFFGGGKK